ncbi:acyl-CoA synthetase (NDP forming) [Novosphingobium hassiacum]|uniref:Acyl-CoA synthetase (NDP forming) n=1 Tax=Novosphingobium hassiacum TaxID=173676 RepID=A0A7W5ZXH9_9SPHN|nr:acyl-CoA synthetase (NDP forming) [Novosphingobium hassiacum]
MATAEQTRVTDLNALFTPTSIVMVGATEKSVWSNGIAGRLADYGFDGPVYVVNRAGVDVHGFPGFTSCKAIGKPVDAAYIFVPVAAVYDALVDAADAGVRGVVILTSGFAEVDAEGAALQERIVALARERGIALLGPNSLGFANVADGRALTVIPPRTPIIHGGIGIISQSGATAAEIVKFAHQQGFGVSFTVATGNEALVTTSDVVDYLIDHEPTRVIAVYSETINQPYKLRRAAIRARKARKAIIILKVGKSELTAAIAQAHTGALVGDDGIFDAACRQLGIIRVSSIEELVMTAGLIDRVGPISRPGIAFVSMSGGSCGMFADLAEQYGLPMPQFAPETVEQLKGVISDFGTTLNPFDITGAVMRDPSIWTRALPIVGADPNVGIIVVNANSPQSQRDLAGANHQAGGFMPGIAASPVPGVYVTQVLQAVNDSMASFLETNNQPVMLYGLEYGARALGHLSRWSSSLDRETVGLVEKAGGSRPQGERDVLSYLDSRGVPVIPAKLVTSAQDAASHARSLGGKVAMKIASPDIAHKTEFGGVKLSLEGDGTVAAAFEAIMQSVTQKAPDAKIEGVIVAPMRSGGTELFVGTARDPQWGPVIAVGLGGVWVEALKDSAIRLLPVSKADVIDMFQSLRGARLLEGYRGSMPVDLDAVADVVVKIGEAALALGPDLASLEINPLLADGSRIEALDGLTVWSN